MFDAIILSDSITGLVTAALLAKEGKSCCLIGDLSNHNDYLYFPFYYNDADKGALGYVLKKLNITGLKIIKQVKTDRALFPDRCIERLSDWREYGKQLSEMFPAETEEIDKYIELAEQLSDEWNGILQGELTLSPKDVPNCVKYFSTSYLQYIQEHFKSDELKGILCIGVPNAAIALSVMSGYLVSQMFDACFVEGGMKNIFDSINKSVDLEYLVTKSKDYKIDVVNGIAEVTADSSKVIGKVVIDARGEDRYLMKDLSDLTYFSIAVPDDSLADKIDGIGYYIYEDYDIFKAMDKISNESAEWYPVHIWNHGKRSLSDDKRNLLRIDIPYKKSGSTDFSDIINKTVNIIKKYFPQVDEDIWKNIDIKLFSDQGSSAEFYNGYFFRWAFSAKNILKNPMKILKSDRVINIDDWGGAWFSSAIIAYLEADKLLEREF